ncbi:uncharacterized protein LOC126983564 isoform X2 [Eriocheir sinensis]|nr:uncharacterized protein LOC126983564 isoform X2 [Eriocheir sinensis]
MQSNLSVCVYLNEKCLLLCSELHSPLLWLSSCLCAAPVIRMLNSKRVKTLKIKKCPCRDVVNQRETMFVFADLFCFLKTCENLTTFHCYGMYCNYTLEILAKSCPHLQNFGIYSNPSVPDVVDLFYLAGHFPDHETFTKIKQEEKIPSKSVCTKLKKVSLCHTKVSAEGALILLYIFPSIEEFEIISNSDVSIETVFEMLYGTDVERHSEITRRYSLKVFPCMSTSVAIKKETLSSVTKTCPHLEDISLVCTGEKKEDTYLLAHLLNLKLVTLKVVNCNIHALLQYLRQKGDDLLNLTINQFSGNPLHLQFTRSDLQNIIYMCPKLEKLTLKLLTTIIRDVCYSCSDPDLLYFTMLTHLSLEKVEITPEDLAVLVSKCKNLRELRIISPIPVAMDDRRLCDLLDSSNLQNLQILYLEKPDITMVGLQRLLNECPRLHAVGPLSSWFLEFKEYQNFIKQIEDNCWELELRNQKLFCESPLCW